MSLSMPHATDAASLTAKPTMDADTPTVLFAGGGTGGHMFPNLAIYEALQERAWSGGANVAAHFAVSNRPLDAALMEKHAMPFTALPVKPVTGKPWRWPAFWNAWRSSVAMCKRLMRQQNIVGVVATGGFVCGPAVVAANDLKRPVILVNLDAVPGRANRTMVKRAHDVFTVYDQPKKNAWQRARTIGLPLRRVAIGDAMPGDARLALGLDLDRLTILIIGGSQGALTLDQAMMHLAQTSADSSLLRDAQFLHICSDAQVDALQAAYAKGQLTAQVTPFVDAIGQAWSAADIAISRAGASCVAEAHASATPTLFVPYPFHRDQHQRLNAQPLVQSGGAQIIDDRKNATRTAHGIKTALLDLLGDESKRQAMTEALQQNQPANGAQAVAACAASWFMKAPKA